MKIKKPFANKVAQMRHLMIYELSLYCEGEDISDVVHGALLKSLSSKCAYMAHVKNVSKLTEAKVSAFASGALMCPAYLAQSALDTLLTFGFAPDSENTKIVMIGLLLTRPDVHNVNDIERYFPLHWTAEYRDSSLDLAQLMIGNENAVQKAE